MELKEGQTLEGIITRIVEEAVFVDVGTYRQAVIPKIDVDQVKRNATVALEIGETIPVYIYYAPKNGGSPLGSVAHTIGIPFRSSKSQRKNSDPWITFESEYKIGNIVEGKVKNIKRYGAFVELPNGIDGLVHVSEMESGFTNSPWDIVQPGENVRVHIIGIEPHRKKISLSLKDI